MEVQTNQAQLAFETEKRIKDQVQAIRTGWIALAGDLYEFTDKKMYDHLGYGSLNEWLAGPDIELERRMVMYLTSAWRELVVSRNVDPRQLEEVNVSKVSVVLPAIRAGNVEIEDALSDAKTLTRSDLEAKYGKAGKDAQGGGDEPEYATCETCGSRYKVKRSDD